MRVRVISVLLTLAAVAPIAARSMTALSQQPAPQQEFVPVNEVPPEEQLPAARLLVIAYAFVWMALLGYVWFLWRRLSKVERELTDVAARVAEKRR